MLATIAGTSFADVREPSVDARGLPAECGQFSSIPSDSTSELLAWAQRLSVAACRQSIALTPIDNPERFPALVETLERAMEPSMAIYRDAVTRGPAQIQILAMYGLGMANLNIIVRARAAVHLDVRAGAADGGPPYHDRAQAQRRSLELLLRREREAALGAFREMARLADEHPEAARANQTMTLVLADARTQSKRLR